MKTLNLITLIAVLFSTKGFAQNPAQRFFQPNSNTTEVNGIAKATEFSIPVSPAFDLLGVTPSQVTKPGNIREFKVDWSFHSWRLKPNLALQMQPIWEMVYNKPNLQKYRRANGIFRTLSTLDLSAGTVEDDDSKRRASLALKINLYREKDPLLDRKLFLEIDTNYQKMQEERLLALYPLQKQLKKQKNEDKKWAIQLKIDSIESHYVRIETEQKIRIQAIAQQFVKDNWNASHIDLAYGKILSFKNAPLNKLESTGLGDAIWLNFSKGIGKKALITGLIKYTWLNSIDTFKLNPEGNIDLDAMPGASSFSPRFFTLGLNYRYGSPKFNFFAEAIYSQNLGTDDFSKPQLNLTKSNHIAISYGGDWRINRNLCLTYGVRTILDENAKFSNLVPIAGISCMMR
ncbi:MAG: hypothetical protein ACOYOA_12815 [Saprospiraceae bacterium]